MAFGQLSGRALRLLAAIFVSTLLGCGGAERPEPVAAAQPDRARDLGTVEFPTTCTAEAQPHFLRGVAALHSFWYPVALEEFRAATRADPLCMMGYWGEAMAHDHPLWGDTQSTQAAREALAKIRLTAGLTARERAWLNAVQVLYGEGDQSERDKAYAEAMAGIYRDYPDDAEAALFYALALMGSIRPKGAEGEQTWLRAGEIASAVYKKKPNHPGAAHYVIHAYDHPKHARLALDAARRYASIAPAAPHALHMPSHIFLQLGMWEEAAASNEASWKASDAWVRGRGLSISERDYHSLHWLMYVYLQQGRYEKAKETLNVLRESLASFPEHNPRELRYSRYLDAAMSAALVVETEQWERAGEWLPPVAPAESERTMRTAQLPAVFARGLAAAAKGSGSSREHIAQLHALRDKGSGDGGAAGKPGIHELQVEAMAAAGKGDFDSAINLMRKATAMELEKAPPSGPPSVIKPPHELFGEILLRAGRPKDAAGQFAIALERHPGRARSLLGAARAAEKVGDTKYAADLYARLARQWQQADVELPELRRAQLQ